MKKTKVLISTIVTLAAFLALPSFSPSVHAAPGTVCLIDPSSSSCPASPASLTGTVGTQLRVSVFLQGSDMINGFDITTLADHTILRPAGVDLAGSILPSPQTILVECIGGILVKGNTCSSTDTVDTIHFAAAPPPGQFATSTTGLLFTAIYNVTSPTSGIPLGFQTGCANTSVPPSTCVTLANGTPTPVPETVQTATFSTSAPAPDFTMAANPGSLTIQAGSSAASTITLTSINGFTGTITLTSSISPSGPTTTLSATSVTLSAGGTGTTTLTVSTTTATPSGSYNAQVSGTSGTISHAVPVAVTVNNSAPDFSITASPTSLTLVHGSSGISTVTLTSVGGFAGTISLSSSISPSGHKSPTLTLSASSVTLSSGGTGSVVLTISTTKHTTPGSYTITISGTSGSLSHSVTITLTVT